MAETPAASPPPSTSDERKWSALLHISALAGLVVPFGHLIGPLVIWAMKKQESALVDRHGKAALNFQISSTIYLTVCGLLVLVLIGVPLLIVYSVFWLVMVIVATIRAADGNDPGYLFSIPFAK